MVNSTNPQKKGNQTQENPEQELKNMVKDLMRRLRQLEERYSNLRNSLHVAEQNMLNQSKKNTEDKKALQSDIAELKKNIKNMGDEMKLVTKELGNTAKKDDVKVLEKYVSFLEPLNFVTNNEFHKEVRNLVKKELEKQLQEKKQNQNL